MDRFIDVRNNDNDDNDKLSLTPIVRCMSLVQRMWTGTWQQHGC